MNDPTLAGIGHNSGALGPIPGIDHDKLRASQAKVRAEMEAGAAWRAKTVEDEEAAAQVADYIDRCRKIKKAVEAEAKEQRKPLDEALKAARAPYAEMVDKLDRQVKALTDSLAPYLKAKADRLAAEQAAAAAAAEEEARRANDAHAQAMMEGDIDAQVEAEKRLKEAEKAGKAANRPAKATVASHTGAGRAITTRKIKQVQIDNAAKVCGALYRDEATRPALLEALTKIINAERRTRGGDFCPDGASLIEKEIVA